MLRAHRATLLAAADAIPDCADSEKWSSANLGHILLAFHFIHDWDQGPAYAAVASQTYELTGLDTGIAPYVNYAFPGLWLMDTVVWWFAPSSHECRPRWLEGILQFIFLFMFFNAIVVFGRSSVRLLGPAMCALGEIGWIRVRRRAKHLVR